MLEKSRLIPGLALITGLLLGAAPLAAARQANRQAKSPDAAAPQAVWLTAADDVAVRGDFYGLDNDEEKTAPVVLLFHQAGSNRGEYAQIAPRLNALGLHALAIDQRSGAQRWGVENETVGRLGKSTAYIDALPDLEAALAWKAASGFKGRTIVWGSSYSAALVFLLTAKHDTIDGVLSFSPGEYLGTRSDEVQRAAKQIAPPTLILAPTGEREQSEAVLEAIPGTQKKLIVPEQAVHGSSMLITSRNPGAAEIWPSVEAFLKQFTK